MQGMTKGLYRGLVQGLLEHLIHADNEDEFRESGELMVNVLWELNQPTTDLVKVQQWDITDIVLGELTPEGVEALMACGMESFLCHRVSLCFPNSDKPDKPVFETGEITLTKEALEGKSDVSIEALLKALTMENLRGIAKGTVKAMRKHGLMAAAELDKVKGMSSISSMFGEVLDEVIAEEIEEQVEQFNVQLDDVWASFPKPWEPPKGGDQHDITPPG